MSNYKINAINDVRQKINEILKKEDGRIVVGWRPPTKDNYKEGDIWEDFNGKRWTIKNGIRQTITKLDDAKIPWFCPVCENIMRHRLDTKYFNLRGKCMNCVIRDETEMRRDGTWKEYEEKKIKQNQIAYIKDKIDELKDTHRTISEPEFIYADDRNILMSQKWNVDIEKVKEDILETILQLENFLRQLESEND